jgi:hypothetical protein
MASFNPAEEWRRCLHVLDLAKKQWNGWDEKREYLSDDEILQIDMTFIEIEYFAKCRRHNVECLVGFYLRYRALNKVLIKASIKMGYEIQVINGDTVDIPK